MIYELIGQALYDPASPNRMYFSIGSAVGTIALLLAFSQLIRPIVNFRLSIGFIKPRYAVGGFLLAILFVFIAAILPFIPGPALPLLEYPVFWEILAGILFVIISIYFLINIYRHVKFNRRNFRAFLSHTTPIIAIGNERDLREFAEEMFYSIEEIVKGCKEYNSTHAHFAKRNRKPYEISEYTKHAFAVLDDWSDAKFCQVMVCNVPKTAKEIFRQITEQRLYDSGSLALLDQLVRQAFLNKNSILHREEDYFGLGLTKTFTNTVFGNSELIESRLNPLPAWRLWKDESLEPWMIQKYTEVLNVATEAHIVQSWRRDYSYGLSRGFDELVGMGHIVLSQAVKLDKLQGDELIDSLPRKNLFAIKCGFSNTVAILQEHENEIPENEFDEANYDKYNDNSIYSVIAYAIFSFFNNLSASRLHDKNIRFLAITLWMDIYPVSRNKESKAVIELQKRINIHLFKTIESNLRNFDYPMLIRLMINIVGIHSSSGGEERGAILFKKKLFELLRIHYEVAFKEDPKKAKDMLPDKVRYDENKGQLIQTYPSGNISVLDLR